VTWKNRSKLALRSAPLAGALLFVGCVSSTDIEGLHRHLGDVEKKVDAVAKQSSSKEEVARLNDAIGKQATTILRSNADLGTKFDDLTRELQVLAGRLEDANRRLTALSQQMAETQGRSGGGPAAVLVPAPTAGGSGAPNGPAPAGGQGLVAPLPVPAGGGGAPAPDVLYRQATADYQRGQFDLARQGFEDYIQSYPKTELSDDAAYWIGECYMAQKKWKDAIGAYDAVVKGWPSGNKVASARLKKALAHLELGEKAQAIVQLQAVVHEYPGSDEAKSARQRLKALGSDSR